MMRPVRIDSSGRPRGVIENFFKYHLVLVARELLSLHQLQQCLHTRHLQEDVVDEVTHEQIEHHKAARKISLQNSKDGGNNETSLNSLEVTDRIWSISR